MNTNFYVLQENWYTLENKVEAMSSTGYAKPGLPHRDVEMKDVRRKDLPGFAHGNYGHSYPQLQGPQQETYDQRYDAKAKSSSGTLLGSEGPHTRPLGGNVSSHSHSGYGGRISQAATSYERSAVEQMLVAISKKLDRLAEDQSSRSRAEVNVGQSPQSISLLSNERLEKRFVERSTDTMGVPSEIGQTLQEIVSRLERLEKHITGSVDSAVVVQTTSDTHIEPSAEGSFLSRLNPFSNNAPRKQDAPSKKQLLESLSERDKYITQLKTQLESYEQLQSENKVQISRLGEELKRYKQSYEKLSAEAKAHKEERRRMQVAYMEERSWQDGHHDKTSGLKKPADLSKDYQTLFTNNSHSVLKHLKQQEHFQLSMGEIKILLCKVFEVAFDTCKKKHLCVLFEDLFKPHCEDSLKLAREQARIYGSLSQKKAPLSPDYVADDVIKQIRVHLPQLLPALSEDPMVAFIKTATATAMNMVSTHPPMFVTCPPATVRSFNSALHREKGWDHQDPPGDYIPLIYLRPILHGSYLSDHPEVLGLVALNPTSDDKSKQPRKAVKAQPVIPATCVEGNDANEDSESDL